ncbi:MAG: adenylosuccinate lyase [Bacteriovoracaceae bacterium]|jgi:adenylosuccinate lyase|nr:adenylosuccinate lyase [Bacteriovoracaceae bacterium]
MIPRYEEKEISKYWSDEFKFQTYLKVELAILEALEGGKIPKGTCQKIKEKAVINPARIDEIEKTTRHDIIAFCTSITENLEPEVAKYFHFGVTSSDIIDTSLTIQIRESLGPILKALEAVTQTLWKKSQEHKDLIAMGRSHGMFAEPLSFGQKLLSFYCEFKRRHDDYLDFFEKELTGQFSGAVGNYTMLCPEEEKRALDILDLIVEPVSTQVIPRDRIAKLVSLGGLLGCAIERIATEIRHLHRSEVAELHEGFSKGQKGSSTMPHKKNPISGENLTGMARLLRSHVNMAFENVVLWHERDISHSSTERMYLPDHFGIILYSLKRLESTIDNLQIHSEVVEKRVTENFQYLSSFYLHELVKKSNCHREDLYKIVQSAAFKTMDQTNQNPETFHSNLLEELKKENLVIDDLPTPDIESIKKIFLGSSDKVFKRVESYYC